MIFQNPLVRIRINHYLFNMEGENLLHKAMNVVYNMLIGIETPFEPNDSDDIDTGLTVDSETPTPIYNGPNAAGVKVLKVNGVNITLDKVLTPASSQTLVFLDEYHGAGGTTTEGVTFPKGLTIYGRWTMVTPAADADGGIICYFGK